MRLTDWLRFITFEPIEPSFWMHEVLFGNAYGWFGNHPFIGIEY